MLEFEVGEGKDRAREEKDRPWPLYKEGEYQASSPWLFGLAYSLGVLEAVGLPMPVLMRIPE